MDKQGLIIVGLGIVAYLYAKSKTDAVVDSVYQNVGYVPPKSDPVTTPAVKVKATANPVVKTPVVSSGSTVKGVPASIAVSRNICRANQKVNIRDYFNPEKVIRQAYVGETLGKYMTQKELTISGVKGVYVAIQGTSIFPVSYDFYYVLKSAVDIVY